MATAFGLASFYATYQESCRINSMYYIMVYLIIQTMLALVAKLQVRLIIPPILLTKRKVFYGAVMDMETWVQVSLPPSKKQQF